MISSQFPVSLVGTVFRLESSSPRNKGLLEGSYSPRLGRRIALEYLNFTSKESRGEEALGGDRALARGGREVGKEE
ncbi:hypothetical protein GUJ93_ZPchr0008g13568 [Zizania palustris]|uniref:Uncharacterized protein n=1 Tax=Zizania palustris TaxID=103762 RepID=A0A8J5RJG0_ZIZPA|nr:hypothetical protein GUJ93_ZPchr0008g13568 [Zizania palustris]